MCHKAFSHTNDKGLGRRNAQKGWGKEAKMTKFGVIFLDFLSNQAKNMFYLIAQLIEWIFSRISNY